MNAPSLRESGISPLAVTITGALLAGVFSFLVMNYFSQAGELRDHDLAIAALKISAANVADENQRIVGSIASIEQAQTTILGALQGLKDANDAQSLASKNIRDQIDALQKQISDLDNILRPPRPPNGH
jgi:small-conductance mechanosensitive channel